MKTYMLIGTLMLVCRSPWDMSLARHLWFTRENASKDKLGNNGKILDEITTTSWNILHTMQELRDHNLHTILILIILGD
jgi:hypothetical protein